MKIMKSHIKAGLILLAAFAAGPFAFGQGLQEFGATPRIDALQARALHIAIRDDSSNPDTNAKLPASVDLRKYLPVPAS